MYGYVKTDNTLSAEKKQIYFAHFCGLCKAAGRRHGQLSRFLVTYDLAFLDIFLRAMCDAEEEIRQQRCLASLTKKRAIVQKISLTDLVCDLSILLGYFKILDDIKDSGGWKRRFMARAIRRAYNKAKRRCHPLEGCLRALYDQLCIYESNNEQNLDAAAHCFAKMLEECVRFALERQESKNIPQSDIQTACKLFYNMGKWIYVIDALDDLADDQKTGAYNPLKNQQNFEMAKFVLGCAAAEVEGCFQKLDISKNREILSNIINRGMTKKAEGILAKRRTND